MIARILDTRADGPIATCCKGVEWNVVAGNSDFPDLRTVTDPGYCRAESVRGPYDVEEAARAAEASPLPDAFGEGLRQPV